MSAKSEKKFTEYQDAVNFAAEKISEQKYIVHLRQLGTEYAVIWQEHKDYIAQDGQSYPDEVWVTQDGEPILVQDLTEDHCRNIIRMVVRQYKEEQMVAEIALSAIQDMIANGDHEFHEGVPISASPEDVADKIDSLFPSDIPASRGNNTLH